MALNGRLIAVRGRDNQPIGLLRSLLLNPGRILSKEHLAERIYDWDADHDSNVIEVYIRRLREKLGAEWIETRRGLGYVLRNPSR